jgi:hypothetical protein
MSARSRPYWASLSRETGIYLRPLPVTACDSRRVNGQTCRNKNLLKAEYRTKQFKFLLAALLLDRRMRLLAEAQRENLRRAAYEAREAALAAHRNLTVHVQIHGC